jgi:hypothetical protein
MKNKTIKSTPLRGFFIFIAPAHYMKARQKYEHTRKPVVVGANPIQASVD